MKDFFKRISSELEIDHPDIVEKDYHLHRLLCSIASNEFLSEKLLFKGGTCLMRGYLDYYRFSEDLDFTWRSVGDSEKIPVTQLKRTCLDHIDRVIPAIKEIADDLGFSFSGNKADAEDVHISSGGRMVYFKLGYHSDVLDIDTFIKIEINFIERILYPTRTLTLKSLITSMTSSELSFLFGSMWSDYKQYVELECYSPEEIYIEKCRAAITRRKFKFRDVIDIDLLETEFGYSIVGFEAQITEKTGFMLGQYARYRENLQIIKNIPETSNKEELGLLIKPLHQDHRDNWKRIVVELNGLRTKFVDSERSSLKEDFEQTTKDIRKRAKKLDITQDDVQDAIGKTREA